MTDASALDARSVPELVRARDEGSVPRFLFFWSEKPRRPGVLDQSCLSQWWPSEFALDGGVFPTAEHFMMWSKARLFGDLDAAAQILAARSPGHAKALGRGVRGFDEATWAAERWAIVVRGSVAKFSEPRLRAFLVASRDRVLVEASPLDRTWGIGMSVDDPLISDPAAWRGLNLLGFALMEARSQLLGT
jgi:ribA/ribD-fused uncharacterized protein